MRRPRSLQPGDTIGIVAPSSPIPPDELAAGVTALEARGYRVVVADHVLDIAPHAGYLAGQDADRAADLNAFFARPDIDAILCARGGYGSMRLLPLLDWDLIRANPKLFLGYSDITSLHVALARRADLVTFHSPMVFSWTRLDSVSSHVFWSLIENPMPFGLLPTEGHAMETMVAGQAEGALAGGNLCLLAHACGTDHAPDFRGKIVLIEDVNEAIYRADRDLIQLKHTGLLDDAAGFVLGSLSQWRKHEDDPPRNSPEALWRDIFAPLGKPTISGFPFGHEPNPLTLPLGVRAHLDAEAKTLSLLEPATEAHL